MHQSGRIYTGEYGNIYIYFFLEVVNVDSIDVTLTTVPAGIRALRTHINEDVLRGSSNFKNLKFLPRIYVSSSCSWFAPSSIGEEFSEILVAVRLI